MKKALVVPYACDDECAWADEFFPGKSIAALPVCGKPIVCYALDELSRQGVEEVLILDRVYDGELAADICFGDKWGMRISYSGYDGSGDEADLRKRYAAFIGDNDVVFVLHNLVGNHAITSIGAFFNANLQLLDDPGECVIPGYSAEAGVHIGTDVAIRTGAEVQGPVFLGDMVRIGRGSTVVGNSVLCDGCAIDEGTYLSGSIIFPRTYIGRRVELIRKIVFGRRIIDPDAGVFVDIEEPGLSDDMSSQGKVLPKPVDLHTLSTYHYTAVRDAATDAIVAEALAEIGRDIAALGFTKLEGVYLGGGYGREEGGAPLYNDLDFFPLVDDLSEEERHRISVALDALSISYAIRLGVHVDFCRPKTRADFKRDERRIMIQEFLRGNVAVYGSDSSLKFLRVYPAEQLPPSEALRTLVNRGMGLYLARDDENASFVARNINKAILGAGDAVLAAERRYKWSARERAEELGDELYKAAVYRKFRPDDSAVATWEEARLRWIDASERVFAARGNELRHRTIKQMIRYWRRRGVFGPIDSIGVDPLARIHNELKRVLCNGGKVARSTMIDWRVFN